MAGAPAPGGTRTACLSGVLLGRIRGGLLCTDGWDRGLTVMGRVCTHAHAQEDARMLLLYFKHEARSHSWSRQENLGNSESLPSVGHQDPTS